MSIYNGSLDRFLKAQDVFLPQAMEELAAGQKDSHWIWFVFPQVTGLGQSETSRVFAIANRAEARSYLADPVLGERLRDATRTMLGWAGQRSAAEILGELDAMKFRSSMTLFVECCPEETLFGKTLQVFFEGERDLLTLTLLQEIKG
jgi:uncharacterized protein (DUF1810 family)